MVVAASRLTKQGRAVTYYARRRRIDAVDVPRLSRTHRLAPGTARLNPVALADLDRPVVISTKVDFSATPGTLFNYGASIVVSRISNIAMRVEFRGIAVLDNIITPPSGEWFLLLAIRPGDGRIRLWNQYLQLGDVTALTPQAFADDGDTLTADAALVSDVSVYVGQQPRRANARASIPAPPAEGLNALGDELPELNQANLLALGVFLEGG